MRLSSPAFAHRNVIPSKYTCDGKNVSPALMIESVPVKTESFVLIVEDPDVPVTIRKDGMWDHWVLWNIPATTTTIPEGSLLGVQGKNTGGVLGYGGPCPPDREHRYYFKLYALDSTLNLPEGSTKAQVQYAMTGHVLEEAVLMGRYKRVST